MGFEELSKGVFERKRDDNETFIQMISEPALPLGRENWAMSSLASFTIKPEQKQGNVTEILRQSWIHLRHRQPSIAAFIVDDKVRYEVPDSQMLDDWVDQTFVVAKAGTTTADIIANRKPSNSAVLHWLSEMSQIVLQTSHWRTDGIGIFYILDEYFDLVSQVAAGVARELVWGTETSRLAPSIEEAAKLPLQSTDEMIEMGSKVANTAVLAADAIGIRWKGQADTIPGATYTERLMLTKSETAAVVISCRNKAISVTAAVHASVAAANYQFANQADIAKPYTSTIRYGLRKYLPKLYDAKAYGSAIYTSGWMFRLPPDTSWIDAARMYMVEYRKGYQDILPAHREYARTLIKMLQNMPGPPEPPPSDLDISSAGVVDNIIHPTHESNNVAVEVNEVTVGLEVVTRQMVCFVWTFRGQLNLQIVYNEAYHDSEQVRNILEFIRSTTLKELGVSI